MRETRGSLNLKIARLEQQLGLIQRQLQMGVMYPLHCQHLSQKYITMQQELNELLKQETWLEKGETHLDADNLPASYVE